jgi:hypothetical protein
MSARSHQQQHHQMQQYSGQHPPQDSQGKSVTALCVAVPESWRAALSEMFEVLGAQSAAEALRALRTMAIDLLVVGADLGDEPFWTFVGRVRRARPKLAWILVGDVSDSDEVRARCLGVLMILGPDAGLAEGLIPPRLALPASRGKGEERELSAGIR